MTISIHEEKIGEMPNGRSILAFTFENESSLRATFMNYGGTLVELEVPDRVGMPDDITLGLDAVEDYLDKNTPYFGALVGRFANRIANGKFTLNGKEYNLPLNEEAGQLHGGEEGFSRKLFESQVREGKNGQYLVLQYTSPDGEMGYPGKLELTVEISMTPDQGIRYDYTAKSDAPTVINFTTHPYFNLAGQDSGSIRQHTVQIESEAYLPTKPPSNTPTGELANVSDGPFDFKTATSLDHRLDSPNSQIDQTGGFDHTFVLEENRDFGDPVACVTEEYSGRKMEIFTSEPGLQFYTGNSLDGTLAGKNGYLYPKHAGFCMETQHFPDSPNIEDFPTTVLNPGETYTSFTEYRFSAV